MKKRVYVNGQSSSSVSTLKARALTAQTAETDAIRFLVGTQSLKFDNQVRKTVHDRHLMPYKAGWKGNDPQQEAAGTLYLIISFTQW